MKLISRDINDLKSGLGMSHSRVNKNEEHTHVYRQTDFLTGHGAYTAASFSPEWRGQACQIGIWPNGLSLRDFAMRMNPDMSILITPMRGIRPRNDQELGRKHIIEKPLR